MVITANTEQRFEIRSHGHHWVPEDIDGLTLMRRPVDPPPADSSSSGWSNVSRRRQR
ncbi:hypothetical protein [Cellulomonas fimi]|uniref:hypothetical protein n=1 Tax=Cellulomonas fimi TaxID=1708 RepID=UPI000313246E